MRSSFVLQEQKWYIAPTLALGKGDKMSKSKKPVGYGNPPQEFQFREGTSGNPKGRPPGSGSLAAAIRNQGDMLAPVLLDGQPATFNELTARTLYVAAAKGDMKAVDRILKAYQGVPADNDEDSGEFPECVVKLSLETRPPPDVILRGVENYLYNKAHPELAEKFPELVELYEEVKPRDQPPPAEWS